MAEMRVAMVSGANRGIGLAIARELARRGCRLSLGVRRTRCP
jgi:NAD(P)-dependent dehydrogenase (short-subunit alcohol dehydrogenase family)